MAYARIDEGFWTDPKIRSLPIEGKMIAAWLFTNPHRHFSGIYYLPKVLIGEEIGLSVGVSEKNLKYLEEIGFLKYSHEFSVVWVIKMLPHQTGNTLNEKQAKGISTHLKTLHGCPLIADFLNYYKRFKIKHDTPINTPTDIKSQSQSQSQSEEKLIAPSGPVGPSAAVLFFSCPYFDVDLDYRMKLAKEYPALPDDRLRSELSKMEDWISDNASKKKFKANGHLANPKLFIKNWLDKVGGIFGPERNEPKGFGALRKMAEKGGQNG